MDPIPSGPPEQSPAEIMSGLEEGPSTLGDFPPEIREAVEGLMYLGYLEDSFDYCGHHFVIRTLRGDEELLAALTCKEYLETLGQARAWAWAQTGLALIAVDGEENFCPPLGPDKRAYARARFQYVTGRWFWEPLGRYLSEQYGKLVDRQAEAAKALEDLSTRSPLMPMPFAGSSTDKGDSEEQEEDTKEDIRDYLDQPDSTESS